MVGERRNELWILLSMILTWRCSVARKVSDLELTRAIWPGDKDWGGYSVVEASLDTPSHI